MCASVQLLGLKETLQILEWHDRQITLQPRNRTAQIDSANRQKVPTAASSTE